MKKINLYKNYGVLGHEKKPVYTFSNPNKYAAHYDVITVNVPEEFELYESEQGTMAKSPWGWEYRIDELLAANTHANPCFVAINRDGQWKSFKLEEA